jgi:hypothetical protein
LIRNLASAPVGQVIINNGAKMMDDASYNTATQSVLTNFWNNIMFQGGSIDVEAYHTYEPYNQAGPSAPFAYSDYNLWDGAPGWDFGNFSTTTTVFNLSSWRAQGWDTHSSLVASDSTIFPNIANGDYTLAPAYQTAGRYGDPVGPRYSINQIMNPSRYGPGALSTGTSPSITQQPQNQTVSAGGTATFSVQVNGSGLFFQWLRSNDGGNTWLTIQGANAAAYTTPQLSTSDNSAIFRCLVSSVGGSAWSGTATLTVTAAATAAAAPSIMMQPSNQTAPAGPTPTFTGVTAGTAPTVATPAPTYTVQAVSAPMMGVQNDGADPNSSPAFVPSVNFRHAHHAVRVKTRSHQSDHHLHAPAITTVSVHPKRTPVRWSKVWRIPDPRVPVAGMQ